MAQQGEFPSVSTLSMQPVAGVTWDMSEHSTSSWSPFHLLLSAVFRIHISLFKNMK